jgi:hypothetical protein
MIADLKADSDRWEAERRQTASRGQPSNGIPMRDSNGMVRKSNTPVVEYRASTTHQSRQYYGPTEAGPGAPVGYTSQAPVASQQGVYDGYQQPYNPPVQYAPPTQGYPSTDNTPNYYVAGADMAVDPRSSARQAPQQAGSIPGAVPRQYTSSTPTYQNQPDSRGNYYSSQTPVSSAQGGYAQQPADPFYGRGAYNHPPFSSLLFSSFLKTKPL